MTTRIVGTLPSGDTNGLPVISHALLHRPKETHVVVAVLSTKRITEDVETGDRVPTAQILAIEVIDPDPHVDDLEVAQRLMRRAGERRHGGEMLPIDVEDQFTELFARVDREHLEERRRAEEEAAAAEEAAEAEARAGAQADPCPECNGDGYVVQPADEESGIAPPPQPCEACDGTGELSPAPADDESVDDPGDEPGESHGPQFSG
jgi:hypothetical protein